MNDQERKKDIEKVLRVMLGIFIFHWKNTTWGYLVSRQKYMQQHFEKTHPYYIIEDDLEFNRVVDEKDFTNVF